MKTLFIVGNGFDIAHGLKTDYKYFREFLCNKRKTLINEAIEFPTREFNFMEKKDSKIVKLLIETKPALEKEIMNQYKTPRFYSREYFYDLLPIDAGNDERHKEIAALNFIISCVDEIDGGEKDKKWSKLEEDCAYLNFDTVVDGLNGAAIDKEGDYDNYLMEALCGFNLPYYYEALILIKKYFAQWAAQIDIEGAVVNPKLVSFFSEMQPEIINFNYTKTIEKLYSDCNKREVYHVHGIEEDEIVFGHNDVTVPEIIDNVELEEYVMALRSYLRKDTTKIISISPFFRQKISKDIEQIYSYGWSLGEADKEYYMEFIKKCPNAIWHVQKYKKETYESIRQTLLEAGVCYNKIREWNV